MLGIILSVSSMVLYLAETAIHIHMAMLVSDVPSKVIILSLVSVPLLLVNIISTVLVFRTMDFSNRGCARTICIILHIIQAGLVWRCLKLIFLFDKKDWREFLLLRLIHTALQSFPIAFMKGGEYFGGKDPSVEAIVLVVIAVCGNALVFSMFNTETYLFESDEFSEFSVRIRKPFGVIILTVGTIFLIFSRCGSIMLFLSTMPLWLPLPLGIHFIIYLFSLTVYKFRKKKRSFLQFLKNICLSYFNLFDILNKENQKISCGNVLMYSGILIQNVVMTGFWMMDNSWDYKYELGTIVSIILSFVCGMFLKCCSCSYLQDEHFEPFSDATFQLALKIAMKQTPEVLAITDGTNNEIKNHEKYSETENHCSVISLENGYIHKTPQCKKKERNSMKDTTHRKDSTSMNRNLRKSSCSNLDLASSNSRNTNTLNASDPNNVFHIVPHRELLKNAHTMPCLTDKKRPELIVRSVSKKSSSLEAKHSLSKNPLPLFPNECSDFVSNKAFDSKHVLSNSVDGYNDIETDSSYSDYSYSYYVDSTDWSSMTCDSNSACTWQSSNTVTIINLHSLPKETISATESVQYWLSLLEDIEQSFDNPSFDSFEQCSSALPSSDYTDNLTSNFKPETKMGKVKISKESDIVLRPNDAFLQFRESKQMSYLPYNKSDYETNRELTNENAIVIWHDKEETTQPSTVQESMV